MGILVYSDMPIHTDKETTANRPSMIMKGKSRKRCTLIDKAVPSERNVGKEVETMSKYRLKLAECGTQ